MKNYLFIPILLLCFLTDLSAQVSTPGNRETILPDGGDSHTHTFRIDPAIRTQEPGDYPPIIPADPDNGPDTTDVHQHERKVFWIHGLGGNNDSWSKAAEASQHSILNKDGFTARKLEGHRFTYSETAGIFGAGSDLATEIRNEVYPVPEEMNPRLNFLIGHSQGGVASRALIYNQYCSDATVPEENRYYGGLVTFGSPLNGAAILNSKKEGALEKIGAYACNALTDGIEQELVKWEFAIDFGTIIDTFCNFFSRDLLPIALGRVSAPITDNYMVGSWQIDSTNACIAPEINKVAFYGETSRDNIFWKTANFFAHSPNNQELWEANEEAELELYNFAMKKKLKYYHKELTYQIAMEELERRGFPCTGLAQLNPLCNFMEKKYKEYRRKRNAYRRGVRWFDDINDQWLTGIGALSQQTVTTTVTRYVCQCDGYSVPVGDPADCASLGCPLSIAQEYTVTTIELLYKPSDGVVLHESSQYMTGATHPPVKLENTSHIQMLNNEETKRKLTNLYNGDYGLFFRTDKRQ